MLWRLCHSLTLIPALVSAVLNTILHLRMFSFFCLFVFSLPTAGSRSSSPGKLLAHSGYGRIPRATVSASTTPADKRSRIPRSQGCSRETSPSRLGLGKARTPAHTAHTSRSFSLITGYCSSAGLLSMSYESGHSLLLTFYFLLKQTSVSSFKLFDAPNEEC